MPTIQETIYNDLKIAMRDKKEIELATLRLIKSEIQYELTKTGSKVLSDGQMISIIKKNISQRQESLNEYKKAGREDLAEREGKEMEVIERYLPSEISISEIETAVNAAIKNLSARGFQDTGKVMGRVMGEFKGKNIDGSKVSDAVKKALQALN